MAVKVVLQKRLEPWRWGAQWLPIRSWQWPTEKIIEVDPLTTQQVAQEFNINHPMVIWHLKQIGKVKKLDKRWLHIQKKKLTAYQKKLSFWNVIFSYSVQQQRITSQMDCDVWWKVDFMWQPTMTSSVVELRRSSRALPKAIFWVMVTVW